MSKIRVGIMGYGNLGRGVELAAAQNKDMEVVAVFTRRDPQSLTVFSAKAVCCPVEAAASWRDKIDVMILCGGSATDLPEQGPRFAELFTTVDSFDTHAKIPRYFDACDKAAKSGGNISMISVGWDPGLFSINRLYGACMLPMGEDYTFWGPGVSQGHSDAIRRLEGVLDARQYTVPATAAVEAVRGGKNPTLTSRDKHVRNCYVVAEKGADLDRITREIKTMPNYFADYDTTVTFISAEEMAEKHAGMGHGGFVIRSGSTGEQGENSQIIEYGLRLGSNPEFTSSVLVAYARAAVRMKAQGQCGAKTVLDVPPAYLSPEKDETLRATLL